MNNQDLTGLSGHYYTHINKFSLMKTKIYDVMNNQDLTVLSGHYYIHINKFSLIIKIIIQNQLITRANSQRLMRAYV